MKTILISLTCVAVAIAAAWIGFPFIENFIDRDQDPTDAYKWLLSPGPQQLAVEEYCVSNIKHLSDFQKIYPRNQVMVWPSFPKRHRTFISLETLLYGRYLVSMEQDIRTDQKTLSAVAAGGPRLVIYEMNYLDFSRQGGWTESYGFGKTFCLDEWNRLVTANGDLSSIMGGVVKDRPLARGEQYLEYLEGTDPAEKAQ